MDNSDPPSPSQSTWPRKKGRLSHQPKALTVDLGAGDEDQISGEEDGRRKQWTEAELKRFTHALLGPDGCWEKFMKNPTRALKKVGVVVGDAELTQSNFTMRLQKNTSPIASMPRH